MASVNSVGRVRFKPTSASDRSRAEAAASAGDPLLSTPDDEEPIGDPDDLAEYRASKTGAPSAKPPSPGRTAFLGLCVVGFVVANAILLTFTPPVAPSVPPQPSLALRPSIPAGAQPALAPRAPLTPRVAALPAAAAPVTAPPRPTLATAAPRPAPAPPVPTVAVAPPPAPPPAVPVKAVAASRPAPASTSASPSAAKPEVRVATRLPAPPPPSAPHPGPLAQIAASGSEDLAEAALMKIVKALPADTANLTRTKAAVAKDGSTLYRALFSGFQDRAGAVKFCERVKTAGFACFVRPD